MFNASEYESKPGYIVNEHGRYIPFDDAVWYMDDEIRETLHNDLAGECSDQYFFKVYCMEHYKKYGEEFVCNQKNPVWW